MSDPPTAPFPVSRIPMRAKLAILVGVGLALAFLVWAHVPFLNGPWYWKWAWREPRLPALPLYSLMLVATAPLLAAQFLDPKKVSLRWIALLLIMVSSFGLRVASVYVREDMGRMQLIPTIVREPEMSGYWTDATWLSSQLTLRQAVTIYPDYMPLMRMHTQSKPPGPVIYWFIFIRWMGANEHTALVGGLVMGMIATLAIPATYLLIRHFLQDECAALHGASFLSLCPGFVLFFPMFDPAYCLLSIILVGAWSLALRRDRAMYSGVVGVTTAASLLIAFNVLIIGLFMIGLALLPDPALPFKPRMLRATKHAAIALGSLLISAQVLYASIGYNPLATFQSAWRLQHALLARYADQRPYPDTVLFDLTDFALGSGWISVLLVIFAMTSRDAWGRKALMILVIVQLLIVAITGLLQSETARVWNFMLPILMIPIGVELARWPRLARVAALTMLSVLLIVIYQNMAFLY